MSLEFRLFELENLKFTMPFNDYCKIEQFIDEIGKITNMFFNLIDEYTQYLKEKGMDEEEVKKKIDEYTDKALSTKIDYEPNVELYSLLTDYEKIIEK